MVNQITSPAIFFLLTRLLRRRSKETSKLDCYGRCEGNSPVTGEFHAQRTSKAEMFPFDDVIVHRSREISVRSFKALSEVNDAPYGTHTAMITMTTMMMKMLYFEIGMLKQTGLSKYQVTWFKTYVIEFHRCHAGTLIHHYLASISRMWTNL